MATASGCVFPLPSSSSSFSSSRPRKNWRGSSSCSSSSHLHLHGNGSVRFIADLSKSRQSIFPSSSSSSSSFSSIDNTRVFCVQNSRAAAVTSESWDTLVLKSECPVVVEFYASWCGPCQMVHRVIDELAVDYGSKLQCLVLDTDKDLQVAEIYQIKAVPVVLIFKDGEKRCSITGTMPKEFYVDAVQKVFTS